LIAILNPKKGKEEAAENSDDINKKDEAEADCYQIYLRFGPRVPLNARQHTTQENVS
jgi:hypothetical protein